MGRPGGSARPRAAPLLRACCSAALLLLAACQYNYNYDPCNTYGLQQPAVKARARPVARRRPRRCSSLSPPSAAQRRAAHRAGVLDKRQGDGLGQHCELHQQEHGPEHDALLPAAPVRGQEEAGRDHNDVGRVLQRQGRGGAGQRHGGRAHPAARLRPVDRRVPAHHRRAVLLRGAAHGARRHGGRGSRETSAASLSFFFLRFCLVCRSRCTHAPTAAAGRAAGRVRGASRERHAVQRRRGERHHGPGVLPGAAQASRSEGQAPMLLCPPG